MSCDYCNMHPEMQKYGKHLLKLDAVTVKIGRAANGYHYIYAQNGGSQFAGMYINFCPFCGEELDGGDGDD